MFLKEYLINSRKCIGNPSKEMEVHYKRLYSIIQNYAPFDVSNIDLVISYSTNKTAELLFNSRGKTILIYDQYLGQVFNMLNRIYFNSTEPEIAEYYSLKLHAEEFQLLGDPEIALVCAAAYRMNIDNYKSYKKDVDIDRRLNYTLIQEIFVMTHELVHHYFKNNDNTKIFDSIKNNTISLLKEKYSNKTSIDNIHSYLNDRHVALYGTKDSYMDYLTKEQIEEIKIDYDKDNEESIQEFIDLVKNDNCLIEEILCDDIATEWLISFCKKELFISIENILDGIYVGLMNLRVLGIISEQARDFLEKESELLNFMKTSQIRLIRYRDKASFYYGLSLNNFEAGFEIQKKITSSNERYSSILSDRILFNTNDKLDLIKSKIMKNKVELDFETYAKNNDLVDKILNHEF
jgi:hypothetical protein